MKYILNRNSKIAFTLAETLITLVIVGIVAALTVPSMIAKYQEQQTVSQLKKAYSTINNAFHLAVQENGTPDQWGLGNMYDTDSHINFGNKVSKYLNNSVNCIGKGNKYTDERCNSATGASESIYSRIILADGMIVNYRVWLADCNGNYGKSKVLKNVCGEISIDINGRKKPNKNGRDIFSFYITKYDIVPMGSNLDSLVFEQACNTSVALPYPNHSPSNMWACAAWVLYNENMDYLHCNDLSWSGKHTCK